jgi:geranylgeranyl pyrophosphate synthase
MGTSIGLAVGSQVWLPHLCKSALTPSSVARRRRRICGEIRRFCETNRSDIQRLDRKEVAETGRTGGDVSHHRARPHGKRATTLTPRVSGVTVIDWDGYRHGATPKQRPGPLSTTPDIVIDRTRRLLRESIERLTASFDGAERAELLAPGKMLRTRLAARLACGAGVDSSPALEAACAATELVHTASLCHDDIIDRAQVRRGRPALWCVDGATAAVLFGDMLICEAFALMAAANGGRHVQAFAARVREVCQAEAEQELLLGQQLEEATYLRLARGMTGPLFAFPACVSGGEDGALSAALDEVGYRIGTAYQVADDLLDVAGSEQSAGKTLGTDARRRKFTLAGSTLDGRERACRCVAELCASALELLEPWPAVRGALSDFYAHELQPAFDRCLRGLNVLAVNRPSHTAT